MSRSRLSSAATRKATSRTTTKQSSLFSMLVSVAFWICVLVVLILASFQVLSQFSGNPPFQSYVVQSGSMEPSIMTGDIIVIVPQSEYQANEVITFRGGQDRIVTHRVVEVLDMDATPHFITKGDANRESDTEVVPLERVLGKVTLTLPKLGYFITFGKSLYGILLLIVLPAAIVVADEVGNMVIAVTRKK